MAIIMLLIVVGGNQHAILVAACLWAFVATPLVAFASAMAQDMSRDYRSNEAKLIRLPLRTEQFGEHYLARGLLEAILKANNTTIIGAGEHQLLWEKFYDLGILFAEHDQLTTGKARQELSEYIQEQVAHLHEEIQRTTSMEYGTKEEIEIMRVRALTGIPQPSEEDN